MKKIEIRSLADYFGVRLPASKIKNRDVRISIVRLYSSLSKADREIVGEIEEIKKNLVGDKAEEMQKFSGLLAKAENKELTEEERKAAKEEADGMTECVRINEDFQEAITKLFNEDSDAVVTKVPLEVLYEAISDCGDEFPLAEVERSFRNILTE